MAPLPAEHVQPSPTFHVTGVDFCGPFYYKAEVRNRPAVKCYICVFVCFATKATHLELVEDLSTPSFIAALKRFISLRGKPYAVWSDNATNFVGAKNELNDLKHLFLSDPHQRQVSGECLALGINWHCIPPRSPHFGGLWEAAVKAAKYHLYRVMGNSILTFHELRTLVCQISAILNSRPLCPITDNPDDLQVLTPGHFLWGKSNVTIDEPDVTHLNIGRLSRWQRVCQIQQAFWKSWSINYLSLLQERGKWRSSHPNLQTGDMVLLKDDNQPPLKWPLGRIDSTIPGEDGVVRVAIIRTSSGLVRRAVTKIAVLPVETTSVGSLHLPTGGVCSQQNTQI